MGYLKLSYVFINQGYSFRIKSRDMSSVQNCSALALVTTTLSSLQSYLAHLVLPLGILVPT